MRMVGAAGIEHARHARMLGEEIGDPAAERVCAATRTVSVSSDFSITQALNGDRLGPVWRRKLWIWAAMNASEARITPPSVRPCPSMCLVAE